MLTTQFLNSFAKTDLTVLLFFENEPFPPIHPSIHTTVKDLLLKTLENKNLFTGEFGQTHILTYLSEGEVTYILMLGAGKKKDLSLYKVEELGGKIFKAAQGLRVSSLGVECFSPAASCETAAFLASGIHLAAYKFDTYHSPSKEAKNFLHTLMFFTDAPNSADDLFKEREALHAGIFLARDLIHEPPNILYPESYANRILQELDPLGINVKIFSQGDLKSLGLNALLGVGQGSSKEPKLVCMEYTGRKEESAHPLALVGKGVTFDSGGISIKPWNGMWEMKEDMAGSAAIVGILKTLALRQAPVNVVGVIGLVENMPDGGALRPSDVIKTLSGKTVEVLDTDAEGRLILADLLWYTQDTFKPSLMIDLATLTGSIVAALGSTYAGCFSNADGLAEKLLLTGLTVNEKLWRMPLHEDFKEHIKSDIADFANVGIGERSSDAAIAAKFLEQFVNDTPWIHLDIAGVAWTKKDLDICPKGPRGFGVALLHHFIKEHYEKL